MNGLAPAVLGCYLGLLADFCQASERMRLVLAINDLPAYSQVFAESYQSINRHTEKYLFELKTFPLKRTHKIANDGLVDGIGAKAEASKADDDLQNLIKIPTPIFYASSALVLHVDSKDVADIAGLHGQKVALINGAIHSMNFIPKETWYFVNNHTSVLSMVLSKRVYAGSMFDLAYYNAARESRDMASQTKLATFRQRVPCFMFIHKKHRAILHELDALMQKVWTSGETQKAYDRLIEEVKKPAKNH